MIELPLKLKSPNETSGEHWGNRAKRAKKQRADVTWMLKGKTRPALPATVTVTRLGPGTLDPTENLPMSAKHVIDAIAAWIGIDDGDPQVRYVVKQERAPQFGVRIEWT